MTFVIITHVPHIFHNNHYYGYAPYVREMNIWLKYVSKVIILAPLETGIPSAIHQHYSHLNIEFVPVANFDIKNFKSTLRTIFNLPSIFYKIFITFQKSHHIHLRCPGNMGLLGCLVQIAFPKTTKTAKYAGNWDPMTTNPWSYKLQKWILNNQFITKNIKVLVYGKWGSSSINIKSFFTASYFEYDKINTAPRNFLNGIKFIFVGTLTTGKRPLYAIQLIHKLLKDDFNVELTIFGDGVEKQNLEKYIIENGLSKHIFIKGNQNEETLKKAYQENHFVILPSESEGWPKAIAEGMFWRCVPMATNVSCINEMLDFGNRGLILELDLQVDFENCKKLIENTKLYAAMSENSLNWSRKYTLDIFEQEIKLLLQA